MTRGVAAVVCCCCLLVAVVAGASPEPQLEAKNGSIHLHAEAGDVHMHTSGGEATWSGALGDIAGLQEQVRQLRSAMQDMMARTPADLEMRLDRLVAENHALRARVVQLEAKVSQQHEDTLLLLSQNRELKHKADTAQAFVQSTSQLIERWFDHFGFQPGWSSEIATVVDSEDTRQDWIAADPQITETSCSECRGPPFYLHGPGGSRADYDFALRTVNSYLRFRFPHRLPVDAFRRTNTAGRLRGQSLFVSGTRLRAESDTNCPSYGNGWCTGDTMSAAEMYVAPVRAAAPSNIFAPASQPIAVENTGGILDITDKLTVEAWVKCMLPPRPPAAGRTYAPVLTKNGRIGLNEDTYAMYQRWKPGRYDMVGFMFKLERASDDRDFGVQTAYKFDISFWYHVVGVYDGQDLIIYVNGVEEGRETIGAVVAYTGPEPLVIGSNKHTNHGSKGSIHAILDEIAVWNRVLPASEIAASTFVPIPERTSMPLAAGQHNLTAYVNFEDPDGWFAPQRENRTDALANNMDPPLYVVPEVGPNQLNATSPNLVLVPSVNRSQHAAFFYDEEQWLSLFPTVGNNNYISFVPVGSLQCTHDAGCPCDAEHLTGTAPVRSDAVHVLLPPGEYHVCHSFTGANDTFWLQPATPITSSDVDPCFGIACGAHGSCDGGSCVCEDGFSGDQCERAPSRLGDGTTPAHPLPACSSLPSTTETGVFFVLDDVDAPATSAVSPALCVHPLSLQAAHYRAAAVIASSTGTSMARLTGGENGGLAAVNDAHSATFAGPLASNTFEHVAVACLDGARNIVEATLTPVPASTLARFITGAAPSFSETLEDGTAVAYVRNANDALVSITITAADGTTSFVWKDGAFSCAGLSVSNAWRLALLVQ